MVLPIYSEDITTIAAMCYQTLSHMNTYDETYTQWICLLSAVDVARKRKTIQFTVTCVMITIVQKTVILKCILDHGRSFSCLLSECLPSVIRRASLAKTKFSIPSDIHRKIEMS